MMFAISELIPFILLVTGMALLPGPNMMLYLGHTLSYGRKAGWLTVAGITSAFIVHITATILGLTALLVSYPAAYHILKYAGIAYLLYLAWKNSFSRELKFASAGKEERKPAFFFWSKGMIGNLLNPQTTLLYFSLLPQFLHPDRGRIWLQNIQLGATQMFFSTMTNLTVVFLVSIVSASALQNPRYQKVIRIVMSVLLAAFAVKMIFTS